jgi:hypothetical protein
MAINSIQELFNQLLATTNPTDVRTILNEIGDYSEAGIDVLFGKLGLSWHPYGDKTSNYSTIGLASKPGRSITERITNAIDAVLEGHSLKVSTKPISPQEAVNEWFGRPYSNSDSGLYNWKYSEGNYDRKVGVILNDSGKKEAPTVDILDFGIGIAPDNFQSTILSLQNENKIKKKYLVGAFGQGGATTLSFCDYVLIISRHIQNPNIISFTVIKEITLSEDYKENCYAYLALTNEEGEKTVPNFSLNSSINLYDTKEKLRLNEFKHGTVVRHYSFRLTNIFKPLSPTEGNLYHYLHCSLFDPLIPFQIIDLRNKESIKQEISTGSRNRLMKLMSKAENELDNSNTEYKLYKPFAFITPHDATTPCIKIEYWVVYNYEKKKNKKTGEEYRDLRSDSNALYVQRKHLAVLTLNGQNQGELTVLQVSKDLGLDLVSKHLVIHIDATEAPMNVKRLLFTTNREMLRDGDVLESIKDELRRILKEDAELAALEKQLEEKEISKITESTDDEVKKQIVKLLREAGFIPSVEGDTVRKGEGNETENPTPASPIDSPQPPQPLPPLQTLPYPDVTRFEIVSPKLKMKIHLNKTALVLVETDADSKYKNEIRIKIEPELLDVSSYFPLEGGRVKWRLKATENTKVGDTGKILVSLTKPNGDQIKDEIEYEVLEPVEKPSKEEKGFVPDFEVLPITPGDDNWNKAWENIPEESEENSSVAYIPKKIGMKTIVYYSTVFTPFKATVDKLKISNSPLYKFFETNYKVWIGYHAILQYNSQENDSFGSDEQEKKIEQEREKDRALVAQMQVKQALSSAELMLKLSKHNASVLSDKT